MMFLCATEVSETLSIVVMDKPWTREETIVAFNAYCKIPFKSCRSSHPLVVEYASLLGRTPSALNMKIGNIGRLDPSLKAKGVKGLSHGARMEEEVWNEFQGRPEQLIYESERIIAGLSGKTMEDVAQMDVSGLPEGKEREAVVRQRVNQSFFRAAVMSSYDYRCCISGVGLPGLVEACHILGWARDEANRTNPRNGLCLNPFFHKAYDNCLLSITPDLEVVVSERLVDSTSEEHFKNYLMGLNGSRIAVPEKFVPRRDFLEVRHMEYLGQVDSEDRRQCGHLIL